MSFTHGKMRANIHIWQGPRLTVTQRITLIGPWLFKRSQMLYMYLPISLYLQKDGTILRSCHYALFLPRSRWREPILAINHKKQKSGPWYCLSKRHIERRERPEDERTLTTCYGAGLDLPTPGMKHKNIDKRISKSLRGPTEHHTILQHWMHRTRTWTQSSIDIVARKGPAMLWSFEDGQAFCISRNVGGLGYQCQNQHHAEAIREHMVILQRNSEGC